VKTLYLISGGMQGTAINPRHLRASLARASVMHLGLNDVREERIFPEDNCQWLITRYQVASVKDIPSPFDHRCTSASRNGRFRCKSVGETGALNSCSRPLANAIADSSEYVFRDLPITAEKVQRALVTETK
jgi:CO/xanthine dehydrogenase Mo-binding subunit